MKKHALLLFGVCWVVIATFTAVNAGIIPAVIPLAAPTANRTAGATSKFLICDSSENCPINGAFTSGNGGSALGAVDLKDPVNGGVYTVTTTGGASNFTATFPAVGGIVPLISGTPTPGDCAKWATSATLADIACGGGGGGTGGGIGNITAVTAAANTTSDQTLQELTVTSGFYNSAAQVAAIYGSGIYSIAGGITPTLTWKVKLCTVSGCGSGTVVTLATFTTTATTASSSNYPWNINLSNVGTHATGGTGNLIVHGFLSIDLGASALTAETVFNDANTAVSSNIDLTAALFIDFTVAASSGSTSNSFTQQYAATFIPGSNATPSSGLLPWNPAASTPPVLASWTKVDPSGSGVFADATNGVVVQGPASTNDVTGLTIAAPGVPFTAVAHFAGACSNTNNKQWGMVISDGTKFETFGAVYVSSPVPANFVGAWNTSTSQTSDRFAAVAAGAQFTDNGWFKIQNDGTNLRFSLSGAGTTNTFVQLYSEAKAAFLASISTIGFFANNTATSTGPNCLIELVYWNVTTP